MMDSYNHEAHGLLQEAVDSGAIARNSTAHLVAIYCIEAGYDALKLTQKAIYNLYVPPHLLKLEEQREINRRIQGSSCGRDRIDRSGTGRTMSRASTQGAGTAAPPDDGRTGGRALLANDRGGLAMRYSYEITPRAPELGGRLEFALAAVWRGNGRRGVSGR
uniref:Uncharacterized protein n=1 Tax=Tanacetum cinerariifolium TaxID=118510 RepID=A0A699GI73_TANCI|nr:hypothetical protein [Tanacetum cinerariifolium]